VGTRRRANSHYCWGETFPRRSSAVNGLGAEGLRDFFGAARPRRAWETPVPRRSRDIPRAKAVAGYSRRTHRQRSQPTVERAVQWLMPPFYRSQLRDALAGAKRADIRREYSAGPVQLVPAWMTIVGHKTDMADIRVSSTRSAPSSFAFRHMKYPAAGHMIPRALMAAYRRSRSRPATFEGLGRRGDLTAHARAAQ